MTIPKWSFSHLETADQCLRKYAHYYVLKDVEWGDKSPEQLEGTRKHDAFRDAINNRTWKLPKDLEHYGPFLEALHSPAIVTRAELKLAIMENGERTGYWSPDAWGRGIADVVITKYGYGMAGPCVLYDWKNGKRREKPFELEIHALLLKINYPGLESFHGRYVWLQDKTMGIQYDLSNTDETWDKVHERTDRIANAIKTGDFPPTESPLCGWCKVKSCEHNPEYRE